MIKQPGNIESSTISILWSPMDIQWVFFRVQKIMFLSTDIKMKMPFSFSCEAKCLLNSKPSDFSGKKNLLFSKHFKRDKKARGAIFPAFKKHYAGM